MLGSQLRPPQQGPLSGGFLLGGGRAPLRRGLPHQHCGLWVPTRPMGAVCTSAPLTAWQCLVCADASQGGLLCLREWAQAQRRMEWGSAAVGCEAGPVAAESTCGWKMGGWGGSLATGRVLGRQAFQKEWSGGSSLVHLKLPPGRGTGFPCFPGSGVGGLLADRPAGSSPFSWDKGSGRCDRVARGTDGPLGETHRVSTQLSPIYRPEILSARLPHGGSPAEMSTRRL